MCVQVKIENQSLKDIFLDFILRQCKNDKFRILLLFLVVTVIMTRYVVIYVNFLNFEIRNKHN